MLLPIDLRNFNSAFGASPCRGILTSEKAAHISYIPLFRKNSICMFVFNFLKKLWYKKI